MRRLKKNARLTFFEALSEDDRTLIFYESTHRIHDALVDMARAFGSGRKCVVARELTKSFETFVRGTLSEVIDILGADANQKKGEFVVLVSGKVEVKSDTISEESRRVLSTLMEELPVKQASSLTAKITGEKKNKLYQWAVSQKPYAG